jgi:hypothetical protein
MDVNGDGRWWPIMLTALAALIVTGIGVYLLAMGAFGWDQRAASGFLLVVVMIVLMAVLGLIAARMIVGMRVDLIRAQMAPLEQYAEVIDEKGRPMLPSGKRTYPAQDFITREESEIIWDLDATGHRIEAPRAAVEHFINEMWPVVRRDGRWKMEDRLYGVVAKFLCAAGGGKSPLLPMGKGYSWRPGVTREDLYAWLDRSARREATTPPLRNSAETP